jgi:hypothetical protein
MYTLPCAQGLWWAAVALHEQLCPTQICAPPLYFSLQGAGDHARLWPATHGPFVSSSCNYRKIYCIRACRFSSVSYSFYMKAFICLKQMMQIEKYL